MQDDENAGGRPSSQSTSRTGSIPSVNQLPQFIDSLDVNSDTPDKEEGEFMLIDIFLLLTLSVWPQLNSNKMIFSQTRKSLS